MRFPMTKAAATVVLAVPVFFASSGTFALWSDASTASGVTINVGAGDPGGEVNGTERNGLDDATGGTEDQDIAVDSTDDTIEDGASDEYDD